MARQPLGNPQWNRHDVALWTTCEIADQLLHGETPHLPGHITAPFPVPGPDTRFWAVAPFELMDFRAPGDGSYVQDNGFFFATGGLGIAATAVSMAARGVGNSRRRRAAERDAEPRWLIIASGNVYVAPSSFTMYSGGNIWTWHYNQLTSAEMVSPQRVRFTGGSSNGRTINWILNSVWSELVFVSWALRHHPEHPQMRNSNWLPAGWLTRAKQMST